MSFSELDKNEVVENSFRYFLETIPLQEMDNISLQQICKSFRSNKKLPDNHKKIIEANFEYLYNWAYGNWMINVFYFRK